MAERLRLKMSKKIQGVKGYILLILLVFVTIMLVLNILGRMPHNGLYADTSKSKSYWATADIAITYYSISPSGMVLEIKNNLADPITLTNLVMRGTKVSTNPPLGELKPGQSRTYNSTDISCFEGTDLFFYDISIGYINKATSKSRTFTGRGTKLEGTCQL